MRLGNRTPIPKDSRTDTLIRLPGEYHSEAEALAAVKRYIDDEDTSRQREIQGPRASDA